MYSQAKSDFDPEHLHQRMFQVAYMMLGDLTASEDLAQEAVTRIVEHRDKYRGEGDLTGWAYSITVNLCRNRRKADRRQPVSLDSGLLERAISSNRRHGPSTSVILHETYERAAVAMRALSPVLREVFILHYVEGLPYCDVAKIVGITQGAARLRAKRARESLKASLASLLTPEVHQAVQAESSPLPSK